MNEVAIGSGLSDKVETLVHRPVLITPGEPYRFSEEYRRYVFLSSNDSKAVDEVTQWRAFKERVDRAYQYAIGVRVYEVDPEKTKEASTLKNMKYVVMGLAMLTGAVLLYFKLFGG